MYKKLVSLLLVCAIVTGCLTVGDLSPKFSYANTIGEESVATSSNAKRNKDKDDEVLDEKKVEVATHSNASKKSDADEDIGIATNSNAVVATSSEATVATNSNAEQKIYEFNKSIKNISLLKEDDYSIVDETNPIRSGDNIIFRFEYKLNSSMKKNILAGNDIRFEYQLPTEILSLLENYNELSGNNFTDAPDSNTVAYIGEFCDEGKVSIDLLSTDTELDDLEKYIDIPILINCEKERIPEKIVFDTKGFKKITLYLYIYEGFEYEETINGVVIRITAENHILPQNTEVRISNVNQDDKLEKTLRNSIEGFKIDKTVAFDISFWSGDNEIEVENGTVNVSFTYPELSVDGDTKVFHIDDDQKLEIISSNQDGDIISFEANHFSVYGFTTTYAQDNDPLGNSLIGGNTSGNWEGHYIYFGWEGLDSNKYNGNDNWLEIKDYVNNNDFYRLNGQLYSGADLMTPIKWRILNNNGSALLLLSDEMLDVYNYGTVSNDHPTWETSDIRHWLDTEFMKNHFTSEEQADIKESKVTDIVAADSNLPEGNTTNDRIFLPSKEELVDEDYGFPVKGESPSRKTTYNNDSLKDRNTAGDRSYWTRSRGDLNYTFLRPFFVTEKGLCGYGANRYCSWILGVRPMLRLDLDSQRYGFNKTDDNLSAGIKFNKSTLEMNVGDIKDLEVIPINIADNLTSLKWISTNPSVVSLGVDGKLSAMSNGTANIYAIHDQYVAQCRITVKENPKQQYKVIFKDGDTIVREIMVEEYTAATAPTLTKDGYTLTWDKDFSNITEDIIINAIWTGNTYNIIYEMNNGTNHSFNPRTYTTGVGAVFQRPTYAGHTFGGWYTTPDFKEGTGIILIAPNQIGDITVYAKWNVADYKITYNLFGGTNHKSNPDSYTFGIGVTLKDPTANGSIFKGWYTTSDFKEGTSITSIDSKTSGDITLYAKWELRTCDIAYVLNGGVNHVSNPTKYTYGEGAIFENPTYSGHIFEGWYLTPDFRNGTNITFLNLNNTGDVTVYAKWKKGNSQSGSGSHGSSGGGSTGGHSGVVSGPSIKDDTYINSIWEQAANGWKLKKQDGKFAIGWVYKDKKWYYFDKDGIMCTGWLDLSGKKYFLFEGTGSLVGAMAEHEWCCIDNRYYYFNENGELIRNLSNEEWINEGYSKSKFFYQRDPEWVAKVKSINPSLDPWVHQACYLCVLSMVINNLGYTDVDPAILYLKNNEDTNIHQDIIKNNFNNEFSETRIKDMSDDEYKHVLYDFLTGGNETGRNNENKLYTQGVVIVYEKGKHYSLAVGAYRRSDSTIVIMVNDPGMEGEEHFINFEESYPRNSEKWIIGALEMWEKR